MPVTAEKETMPIMPMIYFSRSRDIELETDLLLAGELVLDIPRCCKLSQRDIRETRAVIQELVRQVLAGEMPDDAVVIGWDPKPDDGDETIDNDALMARWFETQHNITVRVSRDDLVWFDSEILREMGLAHAPSGRVQ
jgi:hypothetical protein